MQSIPEYGEASTKNQTGSMYENSGNQGDHSDVPSSDKKESTNNSNYGDPSNGTQLAAGMSQRDKKKNKKTASQRKKDEYPLILSPVDSHSSSY